MKKRKIIILLLITIGSFQSIPVFAYQKATPYRGNEIIAENIYSLDNNMLIKPNIIISGLKCEDYIISNGVIYLPFEETLNNLGQIPIGTIDMGYTIRSNNYLIQIFGKDNTYILNSKKEYLDCVIQNNKLYLPISFYSNVLKYSYLEDGMNYTLNVNLDDIIIYANDKIYSKENYYIDTYTIYLPFESFLNILGENIIGDMINGYTIKKDNILLIINPQNKIFSLNGITYPLDCKISDENKLFLPLDFYTHTINLNCIQDKNMLKFTKHL